MVSVSETGFLSTMNFCYPRYQRETTGVFVALRIRCVSI